MNGDLAPRSAPIGPTEAAGRRPIARAALAPLVVKYGGASLGRTGLRSEALGDAVGLPAPVVIVVSARCGITALLRRAAAPSATPSDRLAVLDRLRRAHPGTEGVTELLEELERRFRSPVPAEGAAAATDALLAAGERLSARWFAARLIDAGVPATAVDADQIGLRAETHQGRTSFALAASRTPVRRALLPLLSAGRVPVVTGFVGAGPDGEVVTLGTGGSDYSATALGNLLSARAVELVKRDVSLRSADPRTVPGARPLSYLSYDEAEELAQFGAKVLHPLTVEPARSAGFELRIRPLRGPPRSTRIGPPRRGPSVRAVTLLSPVSLVRLRVPGGRHRPGILREASERLAAAGLNVVTVFTSSAELCAILEATAALRAARALSPMEQSGDAALARPQFAALVTAIGEGLLADLGRWPERLIGSAFGLSATARTFSIALPRRRGPEAVRLLHRALVDRTPGGREQHR